MDGAATTYHSYKEEHVGQTSSKFIDLAIIYAILTPTAVLYWRTTDKLLDEWIGSDEMKLRVGFASAVAVVLFHGVRRILPAVLYEYAVMMSCLCFHLGCRAILDRTVASEWLGPAQTTAVVAAASLAWLVFVGGLRNTSRLPVVVKHDEDVDGYRPVSTLSFIGSNNIVSTLNGVEHF